MTGGLALSKRLPSITEAERALEFTGWDYEGDCEIARDIYREKYGDSPNYAVDSPDGGLLLAQCYLVNALRDLADARRRIAELSPVEDWHGKCKTTV